MLAHVAMRVINEVNCILDGEVVVELNAFKVLRDLWDVVWLLSRKRLETDDIHFQVDVQEPFYL